MNPPSPSHRPRIGGGYSRGQRIAETLAVVGFFALGLWLVSTVVRSLSGPALVGTALAGVAVGALASDFISGFVHWGCDTWGSVDTPLLGRIFIRQFREHHVDPEEICRHDFVEANGTNALLSLLPLGLCLLAPLNPAAPTFARVFGHAFAVSMGVFVTLTSQCHQWAHLPVAPRAVQALQRWGLVLSPRHHDVHHVAPHLGHYCITGGWLDGPLEGVDFWRRLERIITRVTGIAPRANEVTLPPEG